MQHESMIPTHDPGTHRAPPVLGSPVLPRPGYLAIEGAAQYASVSTKTIQRWTKGGLPVYQGSTRGKVLIRPTDIDAYLTRRQTRPVDLDAMVNEVLWGVQGNA